MFASFSALASVLMLMSSANLVNAKMTPSLFADVVAEDPFIPFAYNIDFEVLDTDANELTNSSTKIIEDCIVSSFNQVHDPAVIRLYDANVTELEVEPMPSHILNGAKEEARLTGEGGTYVMSGGAKGVGGRCSRCKSALGSPFFLEWQIALDQCLADSNGAGLDGVTSVKVTAQTINATLEDTQDDMADAFIPFAYNIDFQVLDTDANELTNSTTKIIEDCIVSSFNQVHDPAVIRLYDANVTEIEVEPMPSHILNGAKEGARLTGEGGTYVMSGGATGVGGRCSRCKSALGSPFFLEWQIALDQCLADSNGAGLDGVTNVKVTAQTINATLEDTQDDMVPFEFNIHLMATDPDSIKITVSSKAAVEGCIVSTFNEVHEPKEIQLNDATLTKLETKPTTISLLRGSLINTANYSISGGALCMGGSCNRWKSILGAPFFVEWQNALGTCMATSGVDGLAGITHVTVTLVSSAAEASAE